MFSFSFRLLDRIPRTSRTFSMLTRCTRLASPKCCVASMALAVDTHPYGLLYPVGVCCRCPLMGFYCDLEALSQFPSTLGIYLRTVDFLGLGSGRYWFGSFGWCRVFFRCCGFVGLYSAIYILANKKAPTLDEFYLGPAVEAVTGFEENLFDPSLLFNTVFIRVTNVLSLLPFSGGTSGPSLAGVLMIAVEVY